MDFYEIVQRRSPKDGSIDIYPNFLVQRSNDLLVRAHNTLAIWDEDNNIWATDEYLVVKLVDAELKRAKEELGEDRQERANVKWMREFGSKSWLEYKKYLQSIGDTNHSLDTNITFLSQSVKKEDYVSRRLPYDLNSGIPKAYLELTDILYEPKEREKFEWAVGAVFTGDAKRIEKFITFFGGTGTGKSTIIKIIEKMFVGYIAYIDGKDLASNGTGQTWATSAFFRTNNPLVGIQHDADLSKITDNSLLNSIVSHEIVTVREKYKPEFDARINAMLFLGTNKPVKITDAKSGLVRRLIDINPTGNLIPEAQYDSLIKQINYEIGMIANRCIEVYKKLGKDYYNNYLPVDMLQRTDIFYNFIDENLDYFIANDSVTLAKAFEMYKAYCAEALIEYKLRKHEFKSELKNYFSGFDERRRMSDGKQVRNYFYGFKTERFFLINSKKEENSENVIPLFNDCASLIDSELSGCKAQYATPSGIPKQAWDKVKTTLRSLDTSKLHYVLPPENHIVIDLDLADESGNKSLDLNLKKALEFPRTYTEVSRSGEALHLHYIYDGDVTLLTNIIEPGVEIKTFYGKQALRRKLTRCNDYDFATISNLPLKEGGKKVFNEFQVKSEKVLREQIIKQLHKETHGATKPSIDFIYKMLDDAYNSNLAYDVSDMMNKVLVFANNSSNNAEYCLRVVSKMKFKSEIESTEKPFEENKPIVFFDVEIFPNLFIVAWKYKDGKQTVRMINPTSEEIQELFDLRLMGFNNRRYDNHILYAAYLGYTNAELYHLSQNMIKNQQGFFMEAYNVSYSDIYDFSNKKQSLKKWQIELGLTHKENVYPWDEPLAEEHWEEVASYCENDVITTEAVFNHLKSDWDVRLLLSELSGLTPNQSTARLAAAIMFGKEKNPQKDFIYTDLSEMFPGYTYSFGKSMYRGELVGEGGYVYAEPGIYHNVLTLDIASMHPSSVENLNLFGPYTKKYVDLKNARLMVKHREFEKLHTVLDGMLVKYASEETADKLAYALKIIINIVYGLTSASFDNPFRDKRNVDNIVAKRGALFMINLKYEVQKLGYTVAHIKTDSIKIPNADAKIIDFIINYGKEYGYNFEEESLYEKLCLVNDAVYIAREPNGEWTAVGAQFKHPYVFKTLFSKEPIEFNDLCETKSVDTSMWLNTQAPEENPETYIFIGKVGRFVPVSIDKGGQLLREKEGKYNAVTGTKGYRWMEAETFKELYDMEKDIDWSYYNKLTDTATEAINSFGVF